MRGYTATVQLLLGAGADKEAKNKVSERKRMIETHTHVVDKLVWRRKHHVASFHYVMAEAKAHLAWGLAWVALFFLFLYRCERSLPRGAKRKENTWFLFCNAPVFASKSCENKRRSWECAREIWRIAKSIQNEFFLLKCAISTRSLNRVGCEPETCPKITKVMFQQWSVVRLSIWTREHLEFEMMF